MRIEELRGPKCKFQKCSVNTKNGRRLPPHVAAVSGDGMAEGGLGEVLHGARKLGGQALAADWSKNGRILGIKGQGFGRILRHKSITFRSKSKGMVRGLLL